MEFFKNYFTEYDDALSLSLERDPLGFQVIWTYFGGQIFKGTTTSVATDIRNYTINLLHHAVVRELSMQNTVFWECLKTKSQNNETEARTKLILLLEMMLAYSAVTETEAWPDSSGILGISSARKRWSEEAGINNVIDLSQPSNDPRKDDFTGFKTLLVRQSGLGINGRYKGPFQKMGLLDESGGYANTDKWDHVVHEFNKNEKLRDLFNELVKFFINADINLKIELNTKNPFNSFYAKTFGDRKVLAPFMKEFWPEYLGFTSGTAKILFEILDKDLSTVINVQEIFSRKDLDDERVIQNIRQVEPFLVLLEYWFADMIQDELNGRRDDLAETIKKSIPKIPIELKLPSRLEELIEIVKKAFTNDSFNKQYLDKELTNYHQRIMTERQLHPWITWDEIENKVKVYQKKTLKNGLKNADFENVEWQRDYYLKSMKSIVDGLNLIPTADQL